MSVEINKYYQINNVCEKNKDRFQVMGLSPHAILKVKFLQPFNGPVVVELGSRLIGLRRKEFECLTLTKI